MAIVGIKCGHTHGSERLDHFIRRILQTARASRAVFVVSIIYGMRFSSRCRRLHAGPTCPFCVYISCLILGSKYVEETSYRSKHWASWCGLTPREISAIEREVLVVLQYNLYIHQAQFDVWAGLYKRAHICSNSPGDIPQSIMMLLAGFLFPVLCDTNPSCTFLPTTEIVSTIYNKAIESPNPVGGYSIPSTVLIYRCIPKHCVQSDPHRKKLAFRNELLLMDPNTQMTVGNKRVSSFTEDITWPQKRFRVSAC